MNNLDQESAKSRFFVANGNARARPMAGFFIAVLLALVFFGRATEKVWRHGGFQRDAPILLWIHQWATPARDNWMVFVSQVGDPRFLLGLTAIAVPFLAVVCKRRGAALFLLLAVGGATAFNLLAKLLFRRPRPALWTSPDPQFDYGFPSSHAMVAMAVTAAVVLMLWPTKARWPALFAGGLFVVLVGVSRLYLGVHFPSDVLAGWCASLAWVLGTHAILCKRRNVSTHWTSPEAQRDAQAATQV